MRTTSTLLLLVSLVGRAAEPASGPLHFSEVYLCFAEEHAADLVSGFGHVFVCLPEKPVRSADELLTSPAVNFGADTSPLGEGPWQAKFGVRTCHELLRNNTFFQQRDVFFIKLTLDAPTRQKLSEGLASRLGKKYPYDFFKSNCGAHLAEWILTETGHSENVPSPWLYITPRECIEEVVDAVGSDGILLSPSSASRVASRAKALGLEATDQARAAVHDPELTSKITDPWLRLEVIRLNESRVDPDQYKGLQALRRSTLESPGGAEGAKGVGKSDNEGLHPVSIWTDSQEGPSLTLAALSDTTGNAGLRLGVEAGLRNADTAPHNPESRREAHLLSFEIDRLGTTYRTKVTLASIHNKRNLPGIFGGGSSGFEVGYIDRPNPDGTHGIHAETWSGFYARWGDSLWAGTRLMLRADDIQSNTRIRLLPAIDISVQAGSFTFSASALSAQGELGHRLEVRTPFGRPVLELSLEQAPEGERCLAISFSQRF